MSETYLTNLDTEKVSQVMSSTEENVSYFITMTDGVVESYTSRLDEIMKNIYHDVVDGYDNCPVETLEKYFLELSNCIYFTGEQLEKLGIYDSLSKSAYKEVYNNAYLNNTDKDSDKKNKKTVAELTSIAEGASIYEGTVNDIYSRAYKIVKNKIDAAQTMVSTLSKTISRRMQEQQLSGAQPVFNPNMKRILNEEY